MENRHPGFRTFQILLAAGFLGSFFIVLVVFFVKLTDLNLDLDRVSMASEVYEDVNYILSEGRGCEKNFAGLLVSKLPLGVRKIVNLRGEALLRVNEFVPGKALFVQSMRVSTYGEPFDGELNFILEMILSDDAKRSSAMKVRLRAQGQDEAPSGFRIKTCSASAS